MMRCLKFICKLLGYWVHLLAGYVPRIQHKWVFGSYFGFCDNPKFLYYKTSEEHPEIRSIWIANNIRDMKFLRARGFEAYLWFSLKGLYHTLTAKVQISNISIQDINRCLSNGAFYVNLWHGVGVKKVRWLAPEMFIKAHHLKSAAEMHTSFRFKVETFPWLFRKPDLCLVPSHSQAEFFFSPMMDIPMETILLGNYPRNELLRKGKQEVIKFIKKHEPDETMSLITKLAHYDKVYIYMPTWRNNGEDFVKLACIDWEKLNDVLKKRNALFLLRLHPHTHMDLSVVNKYNNILEYPSICDIYTILPFTDCLITDYSSIYSDYSLMNKEIILFVFDYDEYVKGSYDLKDYDKFYPGTKVYDFQELLSIIEDKRDCHVKKEEREFVMQMYWDSIDNNIDIATEIKNRIGWKN